MSTAAKLIDVGGRVPLYSVHASEVKAKIPLENFRRYWYNQGGFSECFRNKKTLSEVKHKR